MNHRIIEHAIVSVGHLSCSIVFLRFIHIMSCISTSFLSWLYFGVRVCVLHFAYSFIWWQTFELSSTFCYYLLIVLLWILSYKCLLAYLVWILSGMCMGVELLGRVVILCLSLEEVSTVFYNIVIFRLWLNPSAQIFMFTQWYVLLF